MFSLNEEGRIEARKVSSKPLISSYSYLFLGLVTER
jgi:hypothetical protein